MASNQFFIYDTDGGGWVPKNQTTTLKVNQQQVIRAGGLTEEVQIYQMVGQCVQCRPEDVIWAPLHSCGEPVVLSETNNTIWLSLPGMYSVGDPNNPPVLAGDVNITAENFTGVDPSLLGKSDCGGIDTPLETVITNTCADPISVTLCEPIGIETSMAELGCIADPSTGELIGKIMLNKTINEDGTGEIITQTAYFEDGTVVQNYTGPWQVCAPDVCVGETFIGVITDLSLLSGNPVVIPTPTWTLFSKIPDPHPEAGNYGAGFTYIGRLATGGVNIHPEGNNAGLDIGGWNVFAMISETQPADDSNNHYWVLGAPSTISSAQTYSIGPNSDPS